MSFTTRCPACGTMFRVVPDQLKISDGWVRCGHCSDVFDAKLNLQNEPALAQPVETSQPVSPPEPFVAPSAPEPVVPNVYGGSRVIVRKMPIPAPVVSAPAPLTPMPPPVSASAWAPAPGPVVRQPNSEWSFASQFGVHSEQTPSGFQALDEEAEHRDNWDGEWLLSPTKLSRHRDEVAQEIRSSYATTNRPSPEGPSQPASDEFHRELNQFRESGYVGAIEAEWPDNAPAFAATQPAPLSLVGAGAVKPEGFGTSDATEPMPAVAQHLPEPLEESSGDQTERGQAVQVQPVVSQAPEGAAKASPGSASEVELTKVVPQPEPEPEAGLQAEHEHELEHELEPEFVLQARRDAFWRTPAMRAAMLLLAVALTALLAFQWAMQERDQLASRYPASAPWLQAVCDTLGCTLSPPKRIDAVAIDSSTLVRKLGQFYSFDLVLKNSDSIAVAMPALELSLTDSRDNEIARRVFMPQDMPNNPTIVPANGSLSVSMRLALSEQDLGSMAGYRALVFYP